MKTTLQQLLALSVFAAGTAAAQPDLIISNGKIKTQISTGIPHLPSTLPFLNSFDFRQHLQ